MKLTLTIAAAFVGLAYLIVKNIYPDFPLTQEELLRLFLWLVGLLGVVVTEAKARTALIARGYNGFK